MERGRCALLSRIHPEVQQLRLMTERIYQAWPQLEEHLHDAFDQLREALLRGYAERPVTIQRDAGVMPNSLNTGWSAA